MKNKTKKVLFIIFIVVMSIFLIPIKDNKNLFLMIFSRNNIDENEIMYKPKDASSPSVLFENIGPYAFAMAGSNNASRGTSRGVGIEFIMAPPTEGAAKTTYDTLKNQYNITNIAGGYLNVPNGSEVKQMGLSFMVGSVSNVSSYLNGRILIIQPDGTYFIINQSEINDWIGYIDITNLVNKNKAGGWWYVAYLDAKLLPQTSWGISAVYKNDSLTSRYIKMLKVSTHLTNGASTEFYFNSKFALNNNFQLIGVILAAGSSGWPLYEGNVTQDTAHAILSDGTYQQLYETTYKGRQVFKGRTNIDFANNIIGNPKNHNILGGEIDIYDETLSKDYFGGKEIVGYRFQKVGSDIIDISVVGLAQEVKDPNVNITTKITPSSEIYDENTTFTIKTTITNTNSSDNICETAYNSIITSTVDSDLIDISSIQMKIGEIFYNDVVYDATNRVIKTGEVDIPCTSNIVLTYKAKLSPSATITSHYYNIDTKANINYSLLDLEQLDASELEFYRNLKLNKSATDQNRSPQKHKLTVHHYLQDKDGNNTTEVLATEKVEMIPYGNSYNTEPASSLEEKYDLVATPSNSHGTMNDDVNVDYYYKKKKSTITTHHYIVGTEEKISDDVLEELEYDEVYETKIADVLNKTNYIFSSNSGDLTSAIVSKPSYDVIYYYAPRNTNVESTIQKTSAKEINDLTKPITYDIKYDITIKDYEGNAIITIVDNLPYEINEEKSKLDGGVYDKDSKTITWTEEWNDISLLGEDAQDSKSIEKRIELLFNDVNINVRELHNKISGSIQLNEVLAQAENVEDQNLVLVNIPCKIIVHYVGEDDKKITDDDTYDTYIGDKVTIKAKDVEGYVLDNDASTLVVEGKEGTSEYTFKYVKAKNASEEEIDNPETNKNSIRFILFLIFMLLLVILVRRYYLHNKFNKI